jgi:hypothetical protein
MFKEIPIGPEADAYWRAGLLWVWSWFDMQWELDLTRGEEYSPTKYGRDVRYALLLED